MPHSRKSNKGFSSLLRASLLKFMSVLTLGIFGGLGDFWKYYGNVGRREFWQNYVFVPVLLAVLGFAVFRILNVHGFLSPLHYGWRRLLLCLILSPAIFAAALGHIKRLRDMNLPVVFSVINFIPLWGTLALTFFCGIFSGLGKHRAVRPKGL